MTKRIKSIILIVALVFLISSYSALEVSGNSDPTYFKIGWVSALTGPVSKYAAHESAELAVEEINKAGGILGHPLKLIMEDGRCDGTAAVTATKKLIEIDRINYILGGHCSTETVAIAPIAQAKQIIVMASISASPDISQMGDYIFRTSSTTLGTSNLTAKYIIEQKHNRLAIITEDTAFATSGAALLSNKYKELGGNVVIEESFLPDSSDFKALLLKAKSKKPEALYIGVQSQDKGASVLRQIQELNIKIPIFGNEPLGNSITIMPEYKDIFNGIVFVETKFDSNSPITKEFISRYTKKFHRPTLPYGFWNADAYDGVKILANAINSCGPDKEKVKECLSKLKDYQGASGQITFDENGDAIREFELKKVIDGKIVTLE